jgi:hypothetical protein
MGLIRGIFPKFLTRSGEFFVTDRATDIVLGIGKKTLGRIQNTVKIYTLDEQTHENKKTLTNWLDEIFEGI